MTALVITALVIRFPFAILATMILALCILTASVPTLLINPRSFGELLGAFAGNFLVWNWLWPR